MIPLSEVQTERRTVFFDFYRSRDENRRKNGMTWEMIASLISIVTVGIAVGKVIANLSRTLTKLNCSVDSLNSALQSFIDRSEKEHGQMKGEISHLKKDVVRCSIRISHLEHNEKERNDEY